MWTAASVRRVVFTKQPGELFTTRELLPLGARDPIDSELKRLVKRGIIQRLARGVFMRPGGKVPSVYEIACIKAKAFGRSIFQHGSVDSEDTEQVPLLEGGDDQDSAPEEVQHRTFACDGGTSSFCVGKNIIVKLHRVCMRKLKLGDSPAGKVVRKVWSLGIDMRESKLTQTLCGSLLADQSKKLREEAGVMPEWMSSLFHWASPGQRSISWLKQSKGPHFQVREPLLKYCARSRSRKRPEPELKSSTKPEPGIAPQAGLSKIGGAFIYAFKFSRASAAST